MRVKESDGTIRFDDQSICPAVSPNVHSPVSLSVHPTASLVLVLQVQHSFVPYLFVLKIPV